MTEGKEIYKFRCPHCGRCCGIEYYLHPSAIVTITKTPPTNKRVGMVRVVTAERKCEEDSCKQKYYVDIWMK